MNAVPAAQYPVDVDSLEKKVEKVVEAAALAVRARLGLEALHYALISAQRRASTIGADMCSDASPETSKVLTHQGGWTTQIVRIQGQMPFLELRAPEDDRILIASLRSLLAQAEELTHSDQNRVMSNRPDHLPGRIYVWLSHD